MTEKSYGFRVKEGKNGKTLLKDTKIDEFKLKECLFEFILIKMCDRRKAVFQIKQGSKFFDLTPCQCKEDKCKDDECKDDKCKCNKCECEWFLELKDQD